MRNTNIFIKKYIVLLLIMTVGVFLCLPKLEMPDVSPVLRDHAGEILCVQLTKDEKWRLPVDLEEVSPLYLKMLIAYEDKRFFSHFGVDPIALMRALWQWAKNGRLISGGSTLTMQTVRLLKPRPRTILYKIEEIFQAIRLELFYSKKDILKTYLTLAPYGGNVEGIAAASFTYFNHSPRHLTPAKSALLTVLPQSPTRLKPWTHTKKAKVFRDKVLSRMETMGVLSKTEAAEAKTDPIPTSRTLFPRHAPHVMALLRQKDGRSTIDKKTQIALEILLAHVIETFEPYQTAAAIIVDNKTRAIIAYVGSASPIDELKNGYVDMVQAVRSPGSALKPFIYAIAFDDNLIHPETLIQDVATNFHGYTPKNFHDTFHGDVTIREALQQSLNIPVVHLLEQIGPGRFVDYLKLHDVPLFFPKKDALPGLPIALGGIGIRLYDMVALYCALANEGAYAPLTLTPLKEPHQPRSFINKVASFYITKILEEAPAPSDFVDNCITKKMPVAFKTGTSYGCRDAVCVGYNSDFTVGVWTGRADGSACPNQFGRKTAAPILFRIFHTILKEPQQGHSIPKEALMVTHANLPERLRQFRYKKEQKAQEIRFIKPKNNAIFIYQNQPIEISISGGKVPLLLLVNDIPAMVLDTRRLLFDPKKIGFFELAIVDAEGNKDAITIGLISQPNIG